MKSPYARFLKGIKRIRNIERPVPKFITDVLMNKRLRYISHTGAFAVSYLLFLRFSLKTDNEMLRVGAAGSITMLVSESSFYCIDAVNARSKMLETNVGFKEMLRRIRVNEGVFGIFKGYSATYYSSILSGFIYFYFYKGIKVIMKEKY